MKNLKITMPVVNGRVRCPRCNYVHAVTQQHLGADCECMCGCEFKVSSTVSHQSRSITVRKPAPPRPRYPGQ